MGERPATVVLSTVVFVDVEGSTDLLHRVGDEAGLVSVRHQLDVVRERLEAYGGNEVKSLGDGLLLTFASPRQAVSFALASQRALAGAMPRVRFGINTGEVVDSHADVHGSAVNAAARIAGRAVGSEILVSDVVRQLVGTAPSIRFLDRGRCRLRGFSERWHLWEAQDPIGEHDAAATIGRVAEMAAVAALVTSTAAGVGRVLLLEGEAGIGKTQLVREATAQARRGRIGVVEVTLDELVRRPGDISQGLLNAARRGLRPRERLDQLLNGSVAPNESGDDRSFAVVEASVDLLEGMARDQPVLLVTEDLHWADDLSIAVLTAIVRRVRLSRFSVIGSLRPSPRPPALDRLLELVRDTTGVHLRIGSLDEVDMHALASALTGAAPGEALRERLRATAGNPLYVTELVRSLDDDGLLRVEAGVADVAVDVTPASLDEALVRRLSWLPPETNELLRLASLLGNAFTLGDLASITGRPVIDVAAWLREASLAGLVAGDGDRLTFRHDLIREAVYRHMLPAERRDLHRAAGQALARAGAPTQQIADQYARGALPGDVEAITWLERAAHETLPVSPASSIGLLDQAVALAPANWPGRASLQAQTITAMAWCGRFAEAEAIAQTILAAPPDADVEFAALYGLSAVYGNRGDTAASIDTLHRAAAAPGAPPDEAARLTCMAAQLSVMTGALSIDSARHLAEETLALGMAQADATTQCLAHQTLGIIDAASGYGTGAQEHLTTAMDLFESGRVFHASYLAPDVFLAGALLEMDALDDAAIAAAAARQRVEQRGTLATLPFAYVAAAGTHFYAGRWDEAMTELEAGLSIINETGSLNFALYCHAPLAKIMIHRGDLATAQTHLTAGAQRLVEGAPVFGADWLFGTQAELLAATGQLAAALTVAATTWDQTAPLRYFYGHRSRGTLLVRLAMTLGRDELARTVTAELEEGARRSPAASAAGAALQCRSLVERDPDLALEAVARYRETALRPDLAACCEDAAGVLGSCGRREEAIALLHDAAMIYADLDAAADTARVDAVLRELGIRRPRRRPIRPTFGWDALTPTEIAVSSLVAEGLTNPEIGARLYISRRTVETHLSHVFTKIGVASRTHLAAQLSKRTHAAAPAPPPH